MDVPIENEELGRVADEHAVLLEYSKRIREELGLDSVLILTTYFSPKEGTTEWMNAGWGNWYARRASAERFCSQDDEDNRVARRPKQTTESGD